MTQRERDEIRALVLSFSTRISDLPEVQSLSDADYITVVQDDGSKKHSKKATFQSLLELLKIHYPDHNGAKYQGVAHPSDNNVHLPIGTDGFWFAIDAGTYTNYGGITVSNSPKVILYDASTHEWSSEDLWGDINGTISFRLVEGAVADSLDTFEIPVKPNEVFVLGANCAPAGSLGSIVVSEFDYDGNLLKRTELESNPLDFIPQTGTDYIKVTLGYNHSNPIDPEHSEITMTSSIKNLIESLMNYVVDVLQGKYESRFKAIEDNIAAIFSRLTVAEGKIAQLQSAVNELRDDLDDLIVRVSGIEDDVAELGQGLSNLTGRVQEGFDNIQISVDGILARFEDDEGYISELQLTARLFQVRLSDAEGNISTLRQTAEEISAQVENAEGDIALLSIRADQITARVQNAEGDISTLTQRADSITAQVVNAQGDIATLQITANQISSQVENMQGDISTLTQTAQEISARVTNAEEDVAELTITANQISSRVSDAEGNISTLQQTSTALTARLENAEGDITALEVTATGLSTRITNTEGDIATLQLTATSLTSRIENAEGNISTLEQTAESITLRVQSAENSISELEVDLDSITARVSDAEDNIASLEITSSQIEARVSDNEDNIASLQLTAESLTTRISDAEGDISTLEQTATSLTTRITDAEGDISTLEQTATSLTTRITDAEGDISTLEQTATSLTTRITDAEGDISTLEQTATSLTTRITDAEGDISTLEQTATSLTTRIGDAEGDISTLQQTATSLTSRITNAEGDISTLEQTATSLTSRITTAEGDISTLEQTATSLTSRISTAEGNITQINQDIDSIELSVQTVSGNLSDYETLVNATLVDLQNQIDGAIDTWFYNGTPTLNNLPASEWTTTDLKDMHIGDIYYDNESGYAYRFTKDGATGVYSWTLITDSAVVQALADAARAQETANHKRRVFITQPTPPYDAGDLWVKERSVGSLTTYEIYRCITSREDGNFNAADWGPADSYGYQVNKSNLEVLSNAIIGQVISITYNQDGTISSSSASTIEQTSESIKLQVANSAINTGLASGGSINNALLPTGIDITNGNITLIANHISLKNQNNISGLDLVTIGDPPNQRVVIDVSSLNVRGIFTTSEWSAEELALQGYADSAAGDALTAAEEYSNSSAYLTGHVVPLITQATAGLAVDSDYAYLKTALENQTTAMGGLMLTSLIQLGATQSGGSWTVHSGISGVYDTTKRGNGIAAWFGGPMVDHLADASATPYAASLFRMDGSGYLAGGELQWGANGELLIHGASIETAVLENSVRFGDTNITIADIIELKSWFVKEQYTIPGDPGTHYRLKLVGSGTGIEGFHVEGHILSDNDQIVGAGTPGSGGGGGGGSNYLYELLDVDSTLQTPTVGQLLYWGGSEWKGSRIDNVASGQVLAWNGTKWTNANLSSYISLATGTNDGTVHLVINGVAQSDVSVANLGALAYKNSLTANDIPSIPKSKISDFPTTWALANITGADDLKAIEALTGTSGLLKKTAANTWTLDTNTYLTGNQTITLSGDVSGSGTTSITTTIGAKKVLKSMLAQAVQDSLDLADSALQSHQTIYTLTLKVGTISIGTYTPNSAAQTLTITAQNLYDTIGSSKYHPYQGSTSTKLDASTLLAATRLTVGQNSLNTSYAFYVNGTSYHNGASTFNGNVTINSGKTLTIGGATFTWHPESSSGAGDGYLELNSSIITSGDQIVGSGTPGGGGGGGGGSIPYSTDLLDFIQNLTPTAGKMLVWTASGTNNAGTQGGWTLIDKSSVGVTSLASSSAPGLMSTTHYDKLEALTQGITSITKGSATSGGAVNTSGTAVTIQFPTIPTSLPNPNNLTMGSKTYNGSAAVTLLAEDIHAVVLGSTVGTVTITT